MKAICLIAVIFNIIGGEQKLLVKDQLVTNLDRFCLCVFAFPFVGHWLIFGI